MKFPSALAPVTGVTLALVPLIYLVVIAVLFLPGYSEQLRTVVVTAVLSGLLGAIYGYWLDSSAKEAKKESPDAPATVTTTTTTGLPTDVPKVPTPAAVAQAERVKEMMKRSNP